MIEQATRKFKLLPAETEWRAAGFRAQPTPYQMLHPSVGCCVACGVSQEHKKRQTLQWVLVIAVAMLAVLALVIVTFTFVPR